jgi:hypothetical protein
MNHGKKIMMIGLVALFMMTTVTVQAGPIVKVGKIQGPVKEAPEAIPLFSGDLNIYMNEKSVTAGKTFNVYAYTTSPPAKPKGSADGTYVKITALGGEKIKLSDGYVKGGFVTLTAPLSAGQYVITASFPGCHDTSIPLYVIQAKASSFTSLLGSKLP